MPSKNAAFLVKKAVEAGIIHDEDLATVIEVIPQAGPLARQIVTDLLAHHQRLQIPIKFPLLQQGFVYALAKGIEAAHVWQVNKVMLPLGYSAEDMLAGRIGAMVTPEVQTFINNTVGPTGDLFCDFQELIVSALTSSGGEMAILLLVLNEGMETAFFIGLDAGMAFHGYR
jgi:hypothetical protein